MTIDIGTRRGTPGVLDAATALATGRPVVVVDDEAGEGDLVFPAEHATTTVTAFAIRHTSGHLGVALPDDRCRRLRLAAASDVDGRRSAQCVSVDLVGTGTGISAASRGVSRSRRSQTPKRPSSTVMAARTRPARRARAPRLGSVP